MIYTAIYPLRANGKLYNAGESIPASLKGVNYDSLVSKGYISKTIKTPATSVTPVTPATPDTSVTPVTKSSSVKRKPTTEESQ